MSEQLKLKTNKTHINVVWQYSIMIFIQLSYTSTNMLHKSWYCIGSVFASKQATNRQVDVAGDFTLFLLNQRLICKFCGCYYDLVFQ
jgi:hypothetical protein